MIAVKPATISESNLTSTIAEPDLTQGEVEWEEKVGNPDLEIEAYSTCWDGDFFLVLVRSTHTIYKYTTDWQYTGASFLAPERSVSIDSDGTYIYILSNSVSSIISKYTKAGNDTGVTCIVTLGEFERSYSLSCSNSDIIVSIYDSRTLISRVSLYNNLLVFSSSVDITGITGLRASQMAYDGSLYYAVDVFEGKIYKLNSSFVYFGQSVNIASGITSVTSFNYYSGVFYMNADYSGIIYRYNSSFTQYGYYPVGTQVILTSTHSIYQAVTENNDSPDVGAAKTVPTWTYVSPTNKFAMFDSGISTQALAENTIVQTLMPSSLVDSVSVFNMSGVSNVNIAITVAGIGEIYNHDVDIVDNSVVIDMWAYFFSPIATRNKFVLLDIPPYLNQTIVVTFTGGTDMKVGELVLGNQIVLGVATDQTSVQLLDFSTQTRDTFGNFTVTKRGKADLVKFNVKIDENKVGYVRNQLVELSQQPIVWAGGGGGVDDASQVMGFYESFDDGLSAAITFASITVQGLVYDA